MGKIAHYARLVLLVLAILLAFSWIGLFLVDLIAPDLEQPRICRGDVEVIDVYGLLDGPPDGANCYKEGLSFTELRALGKTTAKKIIVVTHYFENLTDATYGIGTSDLPSAEWKLLHPFSTLRLAFVGIVPDTGERYVAALPRTWQYAYPLDGVQVVLVVCAMQTTYDYARAIVEYAGADVVVYTRVVELDSDFAKELVDLAIHNDPETLCTEHIEWFSCVWGEEK